jgi:predicted signal transduction protein with EAL and GGDEF domain
MNDHRKKMIAPVGITALFLAYLIVYGVVLFFVDVWRPVLLILLIPLVALGAGMVYVLITRIREIRSGEEDDLGNY